MVNEEPSNNNNVNKDHCVNKGPVNEDVYTPLPNKEAEENTEETLDEFNYNYNG